MAYNPGTSSQIIVGAAALFTAPVGADLTTSDLPAFGSSESYKDTLSASAQVEAGWDNVGYTMNGLELQFQPDFGEVQVDQVLDAAKLFKQGMQVNLATAFAEATLENLLTAIAAPSSDLTGDKATPAGQVLELSAGRLGECPVERALVAVGPGTGDCTDTDVERVYIAYRALSIENVTVSAKRDEASMFEVTFRLLPADNGNYGKIVDRSW